MAASTYNTDYIVEALDAIYGQAQSNFFEGKSSIDNLANDEIILDLKKISQNSEKTSAVFNNIITAFAIKVTFPNLDVRYHQAGIQKQSSIKNSWFNHRGVSETIIYPWLNKNKFNGAKSGWQTRTLERPKPYMLNYDERIGHVKGEFLRIYDFLQTADSEHIQFAFLFLVEQQIHIRESKRITLATPNISNIESIINHFDSHFQYTYRGKGASRLPVLALYSILQIVSNEMQRYEYWTLKPLENHSAADSQTGSCGDIEFEDNEARLIEGIEVKHNIPIKNNLVNDVITKIAPFQLDRYYILTTHSNCKPNSELLKILNEAEQKIGCQIVVNGVLPTLRYYLRLVSEPQRIYLNYTSLLEIDESVTHEHREVWNSIILH